MVRASYDEVIKPALEHCVKGAFRFPQIQRIPALTEGKRAVWQAVN